MTEQYKVEIWDLTKNQCLTREGPYTKVQAERLKASSEKYLNLKEFEVRLVGVEDV